VERQVAPRTREKCEKVAEEVTHARNMPEGEGTLLRYLVEAKTTITDKRREIVCADRIVDELISENHKLNDDCLKLWRALNIACRDGDLNCPDIRPAEPCNCGKDTGECRKCLVEGFIKQAELEIELSSMNPPKDRYKSTPESQVIRILREKLNKICDITIYFQDSASDETADVMKSIMAIYELSKHPEDVCSFHEDGIEEDK